jgi:voltage-gated potassium channel
MSSLKRIIENSDTTLGRWFDITIQLLIVISIVSFSLETLPDLSERATKTLRIIEIITVGIFTVEYLLRILVADNKLKFILSFFGLVDLLAILPFYIATGLDLRALRAIRLLRTIRLLKLVRYSRAVQRFLVALRMIKEELALFLFLALILFYLAAVGIYYFEREAQPEVFASIFDALWWAVVTLTTVGYGDMYPITVGGKVFTFLIVMIGLGFIAIPTGLIASAMTKARELED